MDGPGSYAFERFNELRSGAPSHIKARSNLWRSTVAWHAASWKLRYWKRAVESLHIDYWNQFSSCNHSGCSFDLWARKY